MDLQNTVLVADLDGSLLGTTNRLHPADQKLLKAGLPCPLILATGRSLNGSRRPFLESGLIDGSMLPYGLVLHNGALTYRPGQVFNHQAAFPPEVQKAVIEVVMRHSEVTFLLQSAAEDYMVWENEVGRKAADYYGFLPRPYHPELAKTPFSKVMCLTPERAILEGVARDLAPFPLHGNFSLGDIYEATSAGVNKASGLKTLLASLELTHARVVAIGDGLNDIQLFECADLGFAPDNACDVIRGMADAIIDPAESGLLGPVLERLA